jgi:hypothetical protein
MSMSKPPHTVTRSGEKGAPTAAEDRGQVTEARCGRGTEGSCQMTVAVPTPKL